MAVNAASPQYTAARVKCGELTALQTRFRTTYTCPVLLPFRTSLPELYAGLLSFLSTCQSSGVCALVWGSI